MRLEIRLRSLLHSGQLELPFPGSGGTATRHWQLAKFAREDVSLARLIEAHTDATAILAEAGRKPVEGVLYGVWASETPDQQVRFEKSDSDWRITGSKAFCTGANIVDRALVTIRDPEHMLVDVDLRGNSESISFDQSGWVPRAFAETNTANAHFSRTPARPDDVIGASGWYLSRPGFWNGACGPASCWAGGAAGLVDYARLHPTDNPHNLAHLGGMEAAVWAMRCCLEAAGHEIDRAPRDDEQSMSRALALRHIIERLCSDILERFKRACGPRPLAFDADASRRFHEIELYLQQCHGERDLEVLGRRTTKVPLLATR